MIKNLIKDLFPKLDKNPDQHNRIIFKWSKLGSNPVTLLFSYFDSYPLITKLYIIMNEDLFIILY